MKRSPRQVHPEIGARAPGTPWGPPPPFRPLAASEVVAIREVYRRLDEASAEVSSSCRACGQCCSFTKGGFVLFASALEMACLVTEAGPPSAERPIPGGADDEAWRCPYQALPDRGREGGLCSARPWRPLGCRTYFCKPGPRKGGEGLYASAYREIVTISHNPRRHERWWYGPAETYLAALER